MHAHSKSSGQHCPPHLNGQQEQNLSQNPAVRKPSKVMQGSKQHYSDVRTCRAVERMRRSSSHVLTTLAQPVLVASRFGSLYISMFSTASEDFVSSTSS